MIEASSTIYISGDTGYYDHFSEIGHQFSDIDLAIIEFGQYGHAWRDIHIIPDDLPKTINDLNPRRTFTTHNGKYALGKHP
jgi:L-ascorbate metabolism protein UlaG (beta-lactamase superfamily)